MPISPKKLLLTKWTACQPHNREKHFLVTRVLLPDVGAPVTQIELQAVLSGRAEIIAWRNLNDASHWMAGWK